MKNYLKLKLIKALRNCLTFYNEYGIQNKFYNLQNGIKNILYAILQSIF